MGAYLYSMLVLFAVTSSFTQDTKETGDGDNDWSPYFGEPISNVTVPLGREAVLVCVVRNLGGFKVGWIRAEDQTVLSLHTKVVTHNPRISVSQDPERGLWRLHIRQLRHSDRGCYMCQINTRDMKKQVGCLDVHVPPDILDEESSGDLEAGEGENVTLTCRARGRPQPRIIWRREDGRSITAFQPGAGFKSVDSWSGEQLDLIHLDYRQMGAYLCIATNDIPPAVSKRIVLVVNFGPVVESPQYRKIGAVLGSSITLSCLFHAHPNGNTSWHTEMGRLQDYGGDYFMTERRNSYEVLMELTIRNLRTIDFGRYYCGLFNERGFARAVIYLYEFQPEVTTERVSPRPRPNRTRTRSSKRITTTTEVIDVLPTYLDVVENEISELAVEAERRQTTSGVTGPSGGVELQVATLLALLLLCLNR